jgi:hypothetical protein
LASSSLLHWSVESFRAAEDGPASRLPLNSSKAAAEKGSFRVTLHRVPSKLAASGSDGTHLRGNRHKRRGSLLQLGHTSRVQAKRPQPIEVFGVIYVGSPPQQFAMGFDTCSGNMLVPSNLCNSVACLSHRPFDEGLSLTAKKIRRLDLEAGQDAPDDGMGREEVKVTLGTGYARGNLAMERVCLDEAESICTMTGLVEALEMTEEPFNLLPYDGILGLGMPGTSIDMRFNFMGNLAEAGILQRNMFATWMANADDDEQSEITFGKINDDRVGSSIMWFPVSDYKTGLWQANLKDFTKGGKALHLCGKKGCQVAFDTGTNAVVGPSRIMTPLLEQLDINQDCSNYAALPNIGFRLGDYEFTLEKTDYVEKVSSSCWPRLEKLDLPPPVGPITLLGDPFLKKYYTIYDRMALRIGVSLAKHKTASGVEGETTEDAASRLIIHHSE